MWGVRIGAVIAVLAALWLPAPAHADISIAFDCPVPAENPVSPPDVNDCSPQTDQVISGIWRISVQAVSDDGPFNYVRRLDLYLVPNAADNADCPGFAPPPSGPVATTTSGAQFGSQKLAAEWTWDTTQAPNNYNGCYQLKAEAVSNNGNVSGVGTRDNIKVDNRPPKPAAPEMKLSTPQGVSLEWQAPDPAVVPDVESYVVLRGQSDSEDTKPTEFEPVRTTTKTFVFDEISSSGIYWYRLVVTRHSVVTPNTGISSDASDISEKPGIVNVPPPTPPPATGGGSTNPGGAGAPRLLPLLPRPVLKPPPVPDAPFSAVLPYEDDGDAEEGPVEAAGQPGTTSSDPDPAAGTREWILPVAFGAWLISTALVARRLGK